MSLITRIDADTKDWVLNAADERAVRLGCRMDLERAAFAIDWVSNNCRLYEGEKAGELIELMDWQKSAMVRIFGWVVWSKHFNRWVRRFRRARVWTGKKNGKALDVDTPIPTPGGWKRMGDIEVGDHVFGPDGRPTEVIGAFDEMHGHDCYKVTFTDGTSIVADAEHLWEVEDRKKKNKLKSVSVMTTADILSSGLYCQNGYRWGLPDTCSIKCQNKDLPIEPYTLGVWLGDGDSDSNRITVSQADLSETKSNLFWSGTDSAVGIKSRNCNTYRMCIGGMGRGLRGGLKSKLRSLGLLNNKHIPSDYLRASEDQRWDLLQGLMDTDGFCSKAGQCEFVTCNSRIADGFVELIRSLGIKGRAIESESKLNGRVVGRKYRISFYCYGDKPCFRLTRKIARLKDRPRSTVKRSKVRRIVSIESVPSRPVRCIAVNNPRKLYLAGPGMVATHNTPFLAALELYLAFGDGEQGQKVYTAASNGDQARISQLQAVMMVKQMPNWHEEYKIYENTYEIRQFSTNSKMMVLTSGTEKNKQAKEGLNGSVCWDELHVVPQSLVNRVSRAGISRAEPLDLAVSTAGLDRNCYGFQEFEYGRKVNSGVMEEAEQDWRYFHVDYALPDTVTDEEFDADPRKYGAMCNPSWGKIIDPDEFENDYRMSKRNTAERRLFMVYRCTKWVDSVTRWIEEGAWRRAGENYTWKDLKGRECYAGLDLSMTKDMTSLVLCFPFEENGKQVYKLWPFFWLPETRIEQLAMNYPFKQWVNDGHLRATPEGRVCYTLLKSQIRAIAKEVDFRGLFYDPYKAEELTQSLCEGEQDPETGRMLFQPIGCERTAVRQGIGYFHEPTATFEHHLLGAEVRHPNHPILTWQASHVEVVTDINKNMKPVKPKDQEYTGKSVDGIVAAIMALAGAVRSVDSQPRVWRIGS